MYREREADRGLFKYCHIFLRKRYHCLCNYLSKETEDYTSKSSLF